MTTNPKQLVLAACVELLRLADEGRVPSPECGICTNIEEQLRGASCDDDYICTIVEMFFLRAVVNKIWPLWPEFSGDTHYPIPGAKYTYLYLSNGEHWKGEQGELRRELLQFTIEQLSKEV